MRGRRYPLRGDRADIYIHRLCRLLGCVLGRRGRRSRGCGDGEGVDGGLALLLARGPRGVAGGAAGGHHRQQPPVLEPADHPPDAVLVHPQALGHPSPGGAPGPRPRVLLDGDDLDQGGHVGPAVGAHQLQGRVLQHGTLPRDHVAGQTATLGHGAQHHGLGAFVGHPHPSTVRRELPGGLEGNLGRGV